MSDQNLPDRAGGQPGDRRPPVSDRTIPTLTNRLVSTLLDAVVAAVLITFVDFILVIWLLHPAKGQKLTAGQALGFSLASVAVAVVVFAALERIGGSPGKRLMRLRLVTLDRRPADWGPLLARYAAICVPLISTYGLVLVVGCLLFAGWQEQRRNAFDLLTRLRVVPTDQVIRP